jgi:hypothetical protein
MIRNARNTILAGVVVSVPILLVAESSMAGTQWPDTATCYASSSGGSCYGTLEGFRTSSDANALAYFTTWSNGGAITGTFGGSTTAGGGGYCYAPAAMLPLVQEAMNHRGYFSVTWNSAGTCTQIELEQGSFYPE